MYTSGNIRPVVNSGGVFGPEQEMMPESRDGRIRVYASGFPPQARYLRMNQLTAGRSVKSITLGTTGRIKFCSLTGAAFFLDRFRFCL